MKKILIIVAVVIMLSLSIQPSGASCEAWLAGTGTGLATGKTLQNWKTNLKVKQQEYIEMVAALDKAIAEAPDPNSLALATAKRDALNSPMIANEAALITLNSILEAKSEPGGSQGREDAVLTGVAGLAALAFREWSRRRLNQSHKSMKSGQARLRIEEPEAEAKLFAFTGEERAKNGL